jgi:dissimilatory sulfite reductase (desulfoviridin) alpha/beta subunit
MVMKWTEEAEAAIQKVPFFVRKKVRKRVEGEAAKAGKNQVTLAGVKSTQARFLSKMSSEIKGYQVETCFGSGGCPNRVHSGDGLLEKIETLLKEADLLSLLKERVKGDLKFHHEFRVAIAECPNACSQPQIKGVGIIAAALPRVTEAPCTGCGACVTACKENAIELAGEPELSRIAFDYCLMCGQCIQACPSRTLMEESKGYRVQLGGRLGRHPRLAMEMPGIYTEGEVLAILGNCIRFFKERSLHGERFSHLLTEADFQQMVPCREALYKGEPSP